MNNSSIQTELLLMDELDTGLQARLRECPEHLVRTGQEIYLQTGIQVVRCKNDRQGNELIHALLQLRENKGTGHNNGNDAYYRILTGSDDPVNHGMFQQPRINPDQKRAVILFRGILPGQDDLYSAFNTIIPTEKNDIIVPIDKDTVVLIKDVTGRDADETAEYAAAVTDTLEGEGAGCIRAGISRPCGGIGEWREAYLEAYRAVSLGARYHGNERVFLYSALTLERIIESIPEDKKAEIRKSFYRDCPDGELSGELLETVRVFFRNDLNLTATAKQLYIHRNTLNYRLDKINKALNLDLRTFHDAVVFKIVSGF